MKRLRGAKNVTHAEMEKGFFYGSFTSPPIPASTVQQLFLRSLFSLVLTFRSSAPSLDVLKRYVKYFRGAFSLPSFLELQVDKPFLHKGVGQNGLKRRESNVFGC